MRKTIKTMNVAHPNEKLICIHLLNFAIFGILFCTKTALNNRKEKLCNRLESLPEGSSGYKETLNSIQKLNIAYRSVAPLEFYMYIIVNCFFGYLIGRFARENKYAE